MSFSFDSFEGVGRVFALRGDHEPIALDSEGVRHPRSPRTRAPILTRYADITHLTASPRVLWFGARDSVYALPRAGFVNHDAPELLVKAIYERIAERPGGAAQLARMAEVERVGQLAGPPRVTHWLIGICVVIFLCQQWGGTRVDLAGQLIPALVIDGDLWRVVTANLLHAPGILGLFHIGINMLALLPLGTMVERPLGRARTICVIAISGVGSMLASTAFGNEPVVGASGIVFGLAGAVLWLDYRRADQLPAWWRFPRRNLIGLVAINGVLGAVLPFVAFAAHAGGLVAGALAAALVTGRVASPAPIATRLAGAFACGVAVVALGTAAMEVIEPGDASARYADRFGRLPGISAGELNDIAWVIATSTNPRPSEEVLLAALALAERAVSETGHSEATFLDTLAEVQFQLHYTDAALATIDEAIALDPDEAYYREQRRRFSGERAADDRPNYIPPMLRDGGKSPEGADEPDAADPNVTQQRLEDRVPILPDATQGTNSVPSTAITIRPSKLSPTTLVI